MGNLVQRKDFAKLFSREKNKRGAQPPSAACCLEPEKIVEKQEEFRPKPKATPTPEEKRKARKVKKSFALEANPVVSCAQITIWHRPFVTSLFDELNHVAQVLAPAASSTRDSLLPKLRVASKITCKWETKLLILHSKIASVPSTLESKQGNFVAPAGSEV